MEPSKNTDKVTHYSILLAPFQPITRIELETHVNAIAECCLDIRNTADRTLNVRGISFKLYLFYSSLLKFYMSYVDYFIVKLFTIKCFYKLSISSSI